MSYLVNRSYDHSSDHIHPLPPSTQPQSGRAVLQNACHLFFSHVVLVKWAGVRLFCPVLWILAKKPAPLRSSCLRGLQPGSCWAAHSSRCASLGESWGLVTSSDLPLLRPRDPRNNQPGLSSWMWTKVLARPVPAFSWNGLWFWEWLRRWVESLRNPLESELEPPRSVYDHAFWINLQASGDCFRVYILLGRGYCQSWREQ